MNIELCEIYKSILFRCAFSDSFLAHSPTVCVTCVWAGVDSVWEKEKPEARKMLENAAESHTSGARFVGLPADALLIVKHSRQVLHITLCVEI